MQTGSQKIMPSDGTSVIMPMCCVDNAYQFVSDMKDRGRGGGAEPDPPFGSLAIYQTGGLAHGCMCVHLRIVGR